MRSALLLFFSFTVSSAFVMSAQAADIKLTKSPKDASAYFLSPKDGDKVSSPVTVIFGLKGMGVAPAGVKAPNTGHHHLIIDGELPKPKQAIPANDTYVHFGKGQTQTEVKLKPGKHTLQIVLGDHNHIPHDPMVKSKKITIEVE